MEGKQLSTSRSSRSTSRRARSLTTPDPVRYFLPPRGPDTGSDFRGRSPAAQQRRLLANWAISSTARYDAHRNFGEVPQPASSPTRTSRPLATVEAGLLRPSAVYRRGSIKPALAERCGSRASETQYVDHQAPWAVIRVRPLPCGDDPPCRASHVALAEGDLHAVLAGLEPELARGCFGYEGSIASARVREIEER